MVRWILMLCFLATAAWAEPAPYAGGAAGEPLRDSPPIILDVLELKDMDINDVFKLIASKTHLNIIAGKNVQGRVTIYLKNVEVHDALHIILEANDLAFVENRGIIQIMPAFDFERIYGYKFGQKTQRKVIALKGMKAVDAASLLIQFRSAAGKVVADEQSNSLIIEELPANLKSMETFVKSIDAEAETRMYELQWVQADTLAARIKEILTPKVGTVQFDGPSNKIFVRDIKSKLEEVDHLVQQLDVPRKTQVFELSYVKPEDMSKTIAPLLTKDVGHVEMDAKSNRLIVTDIGPKMTEIANVIEALDHQDKEVLIEARIVQVTLSDRFRMGINWDAILDQNHDIRATSNFALGDAVAPKGVFNIGTIDDDQYKFVLEALNASGKTRVLSSPSIAVVNNQEAKILVGTTKPYVTTTTTTPASGPTTISESVTFIDVGVKLTVTPTIHKDGYITMKIRPEVSSAASSVITSTNNEIPIVDTSTVDTTIRVKDGVTVVIGGLIKDERTANTNQIPVLGNLPVLGAAFRQSNDSVNKTEIMVFLTPHIISGDVPARQMDPDLLEGDTIHTDLPLE